MVATHIKKVKRSMLCMTGVYLRDKHDFCNFAFEWKSSERLPFLLQSGGSQTKYVRDKSTLERENDEAIL